MSRHVHRVQKMLRAVGFPTLTDGKPGPQTREHIRQFQRGLAFTELPVDGKCPRLSRTYYRLRRASKDGGRASEHFYFRECASRGNGDIKLDRRLVLGLEKYRERVGHAVRIVSGHRDPMHNRRVGGAECSRHSDVCDNPGGEAADLEPELPLREVKALDCFTGLGYEPSGKVRHVDVRHGSTRTPTVWRYG